MPRGCAPKVSQDLGASVHSVTVPGAVDAWARLLAAHGSKGLDELLQPAIACAEDGFVVTPRVAFDWHRDGERLLRSAAGRVGYLPDDRAPVVGQKVRLPALATTLRRIAADGPDAFYRGALAARMVAFLNAEGGVHSVDDFASAAGELVAPISTGYGGLEVWQCPPNGQGVITLLMLNILASFELGGLDPQGAERLHLQAEATRLAFRDRDACLADPARAEVPLARLLDRDYAAALRAADRSRARHAGAAAAARGPPCRYGLPHRGRSRAQCGVVHQLAVRELRQRPGLPRDRGPVPQPRQVLLARGRVTRTSSRRASGRCTRSSRRSRPGTAGRRSRSA